MVTSRKKKADVPEPFEWSHLSEELARDEIGKAVHFSFKPVNTNSKAGGIRLSADQAIVAPYVSARSLISSKPLALEYPTMNVKTVGVWSNVRAIEAGEDLSHIDPAEVSLLKSIVEETQQTPRIDAPDNKLVDIRLRQVSIPIGDQYISITPLPCGGLNVLANQALQQRLPDIEDAKTNDATRKALATGTQAYYQRKPRVVAFGIGGSNPQNAGRLIRSMQKPYFCPGPMRQSSLYKALSMYRKGLPILVPRPELVRYKAFRAGLARTRGIIDSTVEVREQERAIAHAMVRAFMNVADEFAATVAHHRATIEQKFGAYEPGRGDLVKQGLFRTRPRSMEWVRLLSERLSESILQAKIRMKVDGQVTEVPMLVLDEPARKTLQGYLEEAVFKYANVIGEPA